jgi:glyoxylase-like metal-dependent hydrolase (beta-lactamase superfamily II)
MKLFEFPYSAPAPDGELKDVAPGVKWLRMPMPFRLDHINIYLVRDKGGWLIVDTGLNTDATHAIWERVFAALPEDEPITGVLCTHSHTDHAGALGWLVDKLRVPVYMSLGDYYSLRVSAADRMQDSWQHAEYYRRLGMPADHMANLRKSMGSMQWYAPVPAAYRRLRHDEEVVFGENTWRIIVGEGHAPEHVSLYCANLKVLICGDQLLPRISANVGVNATEPDANPLRLWLESLERVGRLPADTLVLPSHDLPYYGLVERARELRAHHAKQLENALQLCAAQPGNAYELMQAMFPRRHGPLDDFLAVGECMAHLAYLLDENKILRTLRDDGSYEFSTASPVA